MKKSQIKNKATTRNLIFSIIIDLIGMLSYLLPGIGETFDIIWAPIGMLLIYLIYGRTFWIAIEGIEEIVPFTDIFPTALATWIYFKIMERRD